MPLKLVISKKVVPNYQHGENIHCGREIFPPLKLRHFFTPNISKNRHMKYVVICFHICSFLNFIPCSLPLSE